MKKISLFIILFLTSIHLYGTHNCPVRIVPGDPRTHKMAEQMLTADRQRRAAQTADEITSTPGIGTLTLPPRVPVILVNFSDYTFSTNRAHADSLFNATTTLQSDLGVYTDHFIVSHGSVSSYFNDQSLGQYHPQFDIIGPITLSRSYTYYGQGKGTSTHAADMITEACTLVNDSVDFAQYDADQDNFIDLVFVFFAGFGENDSAYIDPSFPIDKPNLIWPHYSTISNGASFDGKKLRAYECSNEMDGFLSHPTFLVPAGSGVLVHEYSHGIGLPDVYLGDTKFMGTWDLMDYGCYNAETYIPAPYTGYERWFCGWSQPKMMNTAKNDTLRPIATSGDFGVIAASGNVSGPHNNNTEYWIIENHQRIVGSWDDYALGNGLILYHMKHHSYWDKSANYNNLNGCILLPADGQLRYITEEGLPFVGKQGDCYPYNNLDSIKVVPKFPITGIKQEANGDITFKVCGGAPDPTPTHLDDLENLENLAPTKFLHNGILYIRRGNKLYLTTGHETHIL